MASIPINRVWAMPNKNTFEIPPIKNLILKYRTKAVWIDPFSNNCKLAHHTNDLDTTVDSNEHKEALEYLKMWLDESINGVLFDPPYSPRQLSEVYKKHGLSVNMQTTQSSYWSKLKDEISRITIPGGYVISAAWNSNGIGIKRGFNIVEILLVAHGGLHNDTIVTVERKFQGVLDGI